MSLNLVPFIISGRIIDIDVESEPIACAYSVRKVSTQYQGACCRIRRNDGRETDIGFTQTDIDVKAIKDFIGQGDAWIVRLYDQSGQGFDATQEEYTKQPKIAEQGVLITDPENRHVSIRFDGNQYLDTTYEPTESDVQGSGMKIVASYGTLDSNAILKKQGGSVQTYGEWIMNSRVQTSYPIRSLPEGHDTVSFRSYLLPSDTVLYTTSTKEFGKVEVTTGYGDGYPISPGIVNTPSSIASPQGIRSVSADIIPIPSDITEDRFSDIVDLGNGWLLTVPFNDLRTILINKTTESYKVLKDYTGSVVDGMFSKGIVYDNHVYLIPYNYTSVVRYDLSKILNNPPNDQGEQSVSIAIPGQKLFRDAVLASNGFIYCIPFNAGIVYKIHTGSTQTDFETRSTSLEVEVPGSGSTITIPADSKFYTGAEMIGKNKIICPPYNAASILEIDISTDTVNIIGNTGVNFQHGPALYNNNYEMTKVKYGGTGYTANVIDNSIIYTGSSNTDISGSTPYQFQAQIEYTRVVSDISFAGGSRGSGYVRSPTVRFNSDSRYWTRFPRATVTSIVNGEIRGLRIDDAGEGYALNAGPIQVSFDDDGKGTKAQASATHNPQTGEIQFVSVDPNGSGYIEPPDVVFEGGGGSGAVATAVVQNGRVVRIDIDPLNKGSGYVSDPIVRLVGGQGDRAFATATLSVDGRIVGIDIVPGSEGSGYDGLQEWIDGKEQSWSKADWENGNVTNPFIVIGDPSNLDAHIYPGGKQAFAKVTQLNSNGGIQKVELVYTGRGYKSTPPVTCRSGAGVVPATATAIYKDDGRLGDITITALGNKYIEAQQCTIQERQPTENANDQTKAQIVMRLDGELTLNQFRYPYNLQGYSKFKSCIYKDNAIWAFPYTTYRILKIYYNANNDLEMSHIFADGETDFGIKANKFNQGILTLDGSTCYVLPEEAQQVLRLDTVVKYVEDVDQNTTFSGEWNGGVLSTFDEVIYAIPRNSDYVLAIDTKQDSLTNLVLFPAIASSQGTTKFASVIESSNKVIYAVPQDIESVLKLDPGVDLTQPSLPAPGVLVGSELIFPPSGTTIVHYNSNTLVQTSHSLNLPITDSDGNPITSISWALGDSCVLSTGEVAFVSFYSANKTFRNKVVIYNPSSKQITHISGDLDVRYTAPYPSSCVAEIQGKIIWVPQKGNVHIVAYDRASGTLTEYGSRPSSVRYASGEVSGSRYTAIVPRETYITTRTDVPGFTSSDNSGNRKFEDVVVTSDGFIVVIPSTLREFRIFNDATMTTLNRKISLSILEYVGGLIFGAGAVSSVNNRVFCVPFDYNKFVAVDTEFDFYAEYNTPFAVEQSLYRGLVEDGSGSGLLYAIPWSAPSIAVIDPYSTKPTDIVRYLDDLYAPGEEKESQWWGGVYSPYSKQIYAAPYDAETILVIRPQDSTWAFIEPTLPDGTPRDLTQTSKWSKGCLGPDQKIYFAPWNRDSMLVIDPRDHSIDEIRVPVTGNENYSNIILGENGNLYLIPYRQRSFLEYNVTLGRFSTYEDLSLERKYMTSTLLPSTNQIVAFHDRKNEVKILQPRIQHLLFYDGDATVGSRVNTSTEFWLRPQKDSEGLIFNSLDILARLPNGASEVSMMSQVIPGVVGVHANDVITTSNDWKTTYVVPNEGGVCGALSFSKQADFLSGYRGVSYYCRMGDTSAFVDYIFDSVYTDGNVGSFGALSDSQQIYTYFSNTFVSRSSYVSAGDSGSTFSIGRIFGQGFNRGTVQVPEVSTTMNGYLSECIVFKNDVTSQSQRFGTDQTFYFKNTENLSL
jgi:hypothetical protein